MEEMEAKINSLVEVVGISRRQALQLLRAFQGNTENAIMAAVNDPSIIPAEELLQDDQEEMQTRLSQESTSISSMKAVALSDSAPGISKRFTRLQKRGIPEDEEYDQGDFGPQEHKMPEAYVNSPAEIEEHVEFLSAMRKQMKRPLSVDFSASNIKRWIGPQATSSLAEKDLLVYIHKNDNPVKMKVIDAVLSETAIARVIRGEFEAVGMLHTSQDVRLLRKYVNTAQFPCLLILGRNDGNALSTPAIKIGVIELREPEPSCPVEKEARVIHAKLCTIAKQRKKEREDIKAGVPPVDRSNDLEAEENSTTGSTGKVDSVFSEKKVLSPMELARERLLRFEQEQKYKAMLQQSADLQSTAEDENEMGLPNVSAKASESTKLLEFETFLNACRSKAKESQETLQSVPAENRVTVCFRFPNGSRTQQEFSACSTMEVLYGFVCDSAGLCADLKRNFRLFHDMPPKVVETAPESSQRTLSSVFGESTRELLQVMEPPT